MVMISYLLAIKRCRGCSELAPIETFPKHPRMKDGHLNFCKPCVSEKTKKRYRETAEQRKAYQRRYREEHPEKANAAVKRWKDAHYERVVELNKRSNERYPEKYKARYTLANAVHDARIVKPDACEHCGERVEARRLHGHHYDYELPLDVEWLCAACHTAEHYPEPKFS